MKTKKKNKKHEKKPKVINKNFYREVPPDPPDGRFISNSGWFYGK